MSNLGDMFPTQIEGQTFNICTDALYEENSTTLSGKWHAWCFFAYDQDMNIYPADDVPAKVITQESIAGETRDTEEAACAAVEQKLKQVIRSKNLDGTGFYSPPANLIWPQEFPNDKWTK